MSTVTIYHNPRCSKSRKTLALLNEHNVQPDIVLYLESPPSEAELKAILAKLGITPRALMRKGEDAYKENNLGDTELTDEELIAVLNPDNSLDNIRVKFESVVDEALLAILRHV